MEVAKSTASEPLFRPQATLISECLLIICVRVIPAALGQSYNLVEIAGESTVSAKDALCSHESCRDKLNGDPSCQIRFYSSVVRGLRDMRLRAGFAGGLDSLSCPQ